MSLRGLGHQQQQQQQPHRAVPNLGSWWPNGNTKGPFDAAGRRWVILGSEGSPMFKRDDDRSPGIRLPSRSPACSPVLQCLAAVIHGHVGFFCINPSLCLVSPPSPHHPPSVSPLSIDDRYPSVALHAGEPCCGPIWGGPTVGRRPMFLKGPIAGSGAPAIPHILALPAGQKLPGLSGFKKKLV